MCCTFAFITETWFSDGSRLEEESDNLLLGHGLKMFTKNRPVGNAGFSHGGVAIIARDSCTKLAVMSFPNPENFEVLIVFGNMVGIKRKIYLICAYIPPNYNVPRGKDCLAFIADVILEIKRKCPDALICLSGDFNQWDVVAAMEDFPEMKEILTPATRNGRRIDRVICNWEEHVIDSSCFPPLEAENILGQTMTTSDHSIQFVASALERKEKVVWETYSYRPFSDKSAEHFTAELASKDWSEVFEAVGSNKKARIFQAILDDMMNRFFPMKTVKRKSTDLPWINDTARKKIARKRAVFKYHGRSERWKKLRDDLESYLEIRQEKFLQKQRTNMMGPDASRHFFKNVKAYKAHDKPKSFNVKDLRPGKSDFEVANEVSEYFNKISREFSPLQPDEIPSTYHRDLPMLSPADVESLLKKSKRTESMVQGDLFPRMIPTCAPYLSIPLSNIYNCILSSYVWPVNWKREYVTTIPKKKLPTDFSDLRNISCTLFFSKIFERHVLQCALEEITLKDNQFGGIKGCSTTHMIIELLQEVCSNAEDYRAATILTSIDYAKAFNRVSFQHCLAAFERKHASTPIIRLIATFLTNRTMSVRVGESWSEPREVNGGCPQGSILGVFLFNVTTDDLEDNFMNFENARLGIGEPHPDSAQEEGTPLARRDLPDDPGPVTSSPARRPNRPFCPISPIGGGVFRMAGARRIILSRNARNINPNFIQPPREIKIGTQVLKNKPVKIVKYVDDNIICEKLNFGRENVVVIDGKKVKIRQAISSQNAFIGITSTAQSRGMVVNENKTNLLCISDSLNFKTKTFFNDSNGSRIECCEKMKVLGFYLSDRTGVSAHVSETVKKLRQRYWVLCHLRKIGFTESELVRVYKMILLPIADYCAPAYHSLLTDVQDQELERAQVGALRHIYGYGLSARKLREKAEVQTLRQRRIELTDKFASKCLASDRFKKWFPLKVGRASARQAAKYEEETAKCDRLKNSPIFYMRRRLNGKEGKIYGERNREYRE